MPDITQRQPAGGADSAGNGVPVAEPRFLRALAADLAAVGYTVGGVEELLGETAYAALNREQFVPALLRSEEAMDSGEPLAVLIRLFPLALAVPGALLESALPAVGVAGLSELGLIAPAERSGYFRASADLSPYSFTDESGPVELWVSSDLAAHQRPGVLRPDHVLGIGQASLTLAQLVIREPVAIAADLGVGSGVQTFHLLRHARKVVATDISSRALQFTRFNLLLNAEALAVDPERFEDRVELRRGHLTEPLRGERFDLLVSNPPFVITPRSPGRLGELGAEDLFSYRDGGLAGDQIVAQLVQDLPHLLSPGGTAQFLGNWEITGLAAEPGQPGSWQERLDRWLAPELDAWVIQREQLTPEQYAELWLQDAAQSREPRAYEQAYAAYLEDFASRQVQSVGFGSFWVRRSRKPAPGIRAFETLEHPLEQPLGPSLNKAVQRRDWLTEHPAPDDLDASHLTVPEDVTEERHQRPGAEHPAVILLRQGSGFRRTRMLSSELAGLVSACDGTLSLGQILSALSALLGDDVDAELLRVQVRELIEQGFLIPQEL